MEYIIHEMKEVIKNTLIDNFNNISIKMYMNIRGGGNIITEKFSKLINVKSVVTIILTIVFSILSLRKDISGEQFLMIFTSIIAFYFSTQPEEKKGGE